MNEQDTTEMQSLLATYREYMLDAKKARARGRIDEAVFYQEMADATRFDYEWLKMQKA